MADAQQEVKGAGDKIVTFIRDVAGFCRGDVINLSHLSFEKEQVSKVSKSDYVDGSVAYSDLDPVEPDEEE